MQIKAFVNTPRLSAEAAAVQIAAQEDEEEVEVEDA